AQQPERMRRIGVLMASGEAGAEKQAQAKQFRDALAGLGWTVGRNIMFDYRWPGSSSDLIRAHAKQLVALAPDLILTRSLAIRPTRLWSRPTRSSPAVTCRSSRWRRAMLFPQSIPCARM